MLVNQFVLYFICGHSKILKTFYLFFVWKLTNFIRLIKNDYINDYKLNLRKIKN